MRTLFLIVSTLVILLVGCQSPTSGGSVKTTPVRFSVVQFWFTDKVTGEKFTIDQVRVLGDFNDWGANGGTNFDKVWAGSLPLDLNNSTGRFEAVQSFASGSTIHYTVAFHAVASSGKEMSGWWDPYYLQTTAGTYLVAPFDRFVDNGLGNGGHNAEYLVP